MKKKKAPKEARSRTTTTGTTIAGMRVLVFELEDLWALAAEPVEVAAFAVPLPVLLATALGVALKGACGLKAPIEDSEENCAESVTMTGTPADPINSVPLEIKVEVV